MPSDDPPAGLPDDGPFKCPAKTGDDLSLREPVPSGDHFQDVLDVLTAIAGGAPKPGARAERAINGHKTCSAGHGSRVVRVLPGRTGQAQDAAIAGLGKPTTPERIQLSGKRVDVMIEQVGTLAELREHLARAQGRAIVNGLPFVDGGSVVCYLCRGRVGESEQVMLNEGPEGLRWQVTVNHLDCGNTTR